MRTYEVYIQEIEKYTVILSAEDADQATELAYAAISTEQGKAKYHEDSDGLCDVCDLGEDDE